MTTDVLIAGAGPTGLTLGIDLARRGVAVRIVDKATVPFNGSRGDGLQPRTLEVFDDLGVVDAVLSAGIAPPPTRAYAHGEVVWEGRMSELTPPTPDRPYPHPWMLGQSRTERILREHLHALGVEVQWRTELTGFTQDADCVSAELTTPAGTERVRAAYVVGADGGASNVRKALGIPFHGTTDEDLRLLLGDVAADGLDHSYGHWFMTDPSNRMDGIGLTPLAGGDQFQFGARLDSREAGTDLAALQRMLDARSGGAVFQLRDLSWSIVWRPNIRLADRFQIGRAFLAGDSAHVHPPTGGQGLNTGVQDAYNLGWKVAAALQGDSALLETYEAERLPVAARVLGISTELMRKYMEGAEDAHVRGEDTRQLDITYRGGPLADGSRARSGDLRSGDRAPDAPVTRADGTPARLFDLFRGVDATLLVFGDTAAPPAPENARLHRVLPPGTPSSRTAPADVVDHAGHARAAYGVAAGDSVLVRPDGHISRFFESH